MLGFIIILSFAQFSLSNFKEVLRIGEKPGVEFLEVFDVAVDNDDNVYVSDKLEYSLKKFDKNGNLVATVGRRGSGPGEFRIGPGPVTCTDSTVVVVDFTTPLVHFFTKELKYLKSIALPASVFDICSDGEKVYISYVNLKGSKFSTEIAVYGAWGNKLNSYKVGADFNNPFLGYANISSNDDFLILSYVVRNKIVLADKKTGKIVNEFSINELPLESKFRKFDDPGMFEVPEGNLFNGVTFDNWNKYIYVLGGDYSKNAWKDIYVLSELGKLIHTITLDDKTKFIVFKSGHLYISGKDKTIVKKYKISYAKK